MPARRAQVTLEILKEKAFPWRSTREGRARQFLGHLVRSLPRGNSWLIEMQQKTAPGVSRCWHRHGRRRREGGDSFRHKDASNVNGAKAQMNYPS